MTAEPLAPYAAQPSNSRGRQYAEAAPTFRSEYQRDRDRVIHSGAFRRLEYKTQVFVNHEGDLFRTRLTHSIEVAQIARTIARALNLNEDLAEAIALAHDLGHTPFGHAGQSALNGCMRAYGGFEHNLQSLRVVDALERRYADFDGLNLCWETREGILKHCSRRNARDLGDVALRFLQGGQPSLEAQVANLADEIAYNNHDIDDGLRAGLLTVGQLCEVELFAIQYEAVQTQYPQLENRRQIYEVVRRMISAYVVELVQSSRASIAAAAPLAIADVRASQKPMVCYSSQFQQRNTALKVYLREQLYSHYRVHRVMTKAAKVIEELFDAFFGDLKLLPPKFKQRAEQAELESGEVGRARSVADYIAGMTDRYALDEHERVTNPRRLD